MGRFTDRITPSKPGRRAPPPEVGPFEPFFIDPEMEPGKKSELAVADRTFVVVVYRWTFDDHDWRQMSVRRHDNKPMRDHWATMMAIKNAVLGEEAEAMELYPAASRVVDVEHIYHLWSPVGEFIRVGFAVDEPVVDKKATGEER